MKSKLFIVLLFLPISVFAYYYPGQPAGFVNDYANILRPDQRDNLELKLRNFEAETSNELSVVTLPNLQGDTIENFAEKLFKDWGIGKEEKDNGILLLIALEERKMRIEVGYGLEGALTDAQSFIIIDSILKPAFKLSDYYDGINRATNAIIDATKGEYQPQAPGKSALNYMDWSFAFFFIFMWLASILSRSKSWWLGGVIGGIIGVIIWSIIWTSALILFGLLFDFIVSRAYHRGKQTGHYPWWIGGGKPGGGMGGFRGFGGGMSGGGGASGDW